MGFTAYNNEDLRVERGDTIVYNTAVTNYPQGSYDTTSGRFTCPVTGLYMFATAVYTGDSHFHTQLVKAGQALSTAFADSDVRKLLSHVGKLIVFKII